MLPTTPSNLPGSVFPAKCLGAMRTPVINHVTRNQEVPGTYECRTINREDGHAKFSVSVIEIDNGLKNNHVYKQRRRTRKYWV
ncbi:hypothetical protein NDU88_003078 [Pleurodeles waltl]|uniref:Uncharacterized protein n=1 Tax=Pleurodeles waltl TaxID=8319 RepID=A0AAV7SF36_PLEWA|nr:hypothetical protein NDU88_003078 [Pleurodeles waltl]